MPKPNRVCKYSNCSKEFFACNDSIRIGGYKAHCCSPEHFEKWQTEVLYFRGEDVSKSPYLAEMVSDGVLPESALPKKFKSKKESEVLENN